MEISTPYYRKRGKDMVIHVEPVGSKLRLRFDFNRDLVDEVKAMVGARWDPKTKSWSVDHCERNLLQLYILSGKPPPAYVRYHGELPPVKPRRDNLRRHQLIMLSHALHRRRTLLAAHMGTGKTLVAIELLEEIHSRFPEGKLLYVGRSTPLEATKLELRKWRSPLANRPDILQMCTFDGLRRFLEAWPTGQPAPRAVIFDESQNIKNPAAKRTEAAQHLTDAMHQDHDDDYWVLTMTGTPAPKDYCDWFSQCEVTYPGWLRESNIHTFRRRLAVIEKIDGPYGSFPKLVAWKGDEVELLGRRLVGLVHRVTREDADLDLPPVEYEELSCPPTPAMMRAARTLAMTSNAGIDLLERLRQLADGISYRDDGVETAEVPKDKELKRLLDLHADSGRFGIYAAYTASVDKCAAMAVEAGWTVLRVDGRGMHLLGKGNYSSPQDALAACQTSGSPDDLLCFVGQPGAGGVGLNLQGINGLCFYSNTFNGGDRQQAEARPQRIGNKGLRIYDLLCLPTDVMVLKNLQAKRDAQELVLGELRAAILKE